MTKTTTEAQIERLIDEAYPAYVYLRQHEDEMEEFLRKTLVGKNIKTVSTPKATIPKQEVLRPFFEGTYMWENNAEAYVYGIVPDVSSYGRFYPVTSMFNRNQANFVSDEDALELANRLRDFDEKTRAVSKMIDRVCDLVETNLQLFFTVTGRWS